VFSALDREPATARYPRGTCDSPRGNQQPRPARPSIVMDTATTTDEAGLPPGSPPAPHLPGPSSDRRDVAGHHATSSQPDRRGRDDRGSPGKAWLHGTDPAGSRVGGTYLACDESPGAPGRELRGSLPTSRRSPNVGAAPTGHISGSSLERGGARSPTSWEPLRRGPDHQRRATRLPTSGGD